MANNVHVDSIIYPGSCERSVYLIMIMIPCTQNLTGRQGGQKTVNMTGLGPQSDKL